MTLEASEAPAEAMPEAAPAEPAEQKTRTLPGADCFAVVSESVTRTSADFTLTNEDGAVLALRSEYWLETQADSEWKMLTSNLFKAQNQTDEAAPESSVCTLHYDWQTLYGELDAGKYRLAQPVILPGPAGTDVRPGRTGDICLLRRRALVFILRAGCPASVMRQTARGDAIPWRGRGFF